MRDEKDTSYSCIASPSEGRAHRPKPSEVRCRSLDPRIAFSRKKKDSSPFMLKPNTLKTKLMEEINLTAASSASQCRLIGTLPLFSEKIRRAISSKQRFRPGKGIHPLFLTF